MACRFCGTPLGQHAPQGYGPAPMVYGQPPPQPPGYGGYGGYGAAQPPGGPGGYGAPQGYGGPPPYGGPQPYGPQVSGFGGAPVQPFGGGYGRQVNNGWGGSGMSSFFAFRLVIIAIAVSLSLLGACISALAH